MSVKEKILKVLETNKGTSISGESLAKEMGVSRTAVWKAIKALREDGYQIEAAPNKGYFISEGEDPVSKQGIKQYLRPKWQRLPLHIYRTVDSTNNVAKQLALEEAEHGTAVLAFHQSKGKGRLGRSFISPANSGIYLSILLKPSFDMGHAILVTTAASVAVARAIETVCNQQAEIKWVNDVYLNKKKICGILTEAITDFETGEIQYLILGIGVNCSTEDMPGELLNVIGAVEGDFQKNQLAAEIINHAMDLMDDLQSRSFIDEYRRRSMILGKDIKVYKGGYTEESSGLTARALDIDSDGGLKVIYSTGERETLSTGEVSIRI